MLKKFIPVLAISPLFTSVISTAIYTPPVKAQMVPTICSEFITPNANLNAVALYPQDTNIYSGTLRITKVNSSKWSGVLNIDGTPQNVSGNIEQTAFNLRRDSGQTWTATCSNFGISGNFKKDGLPAIGSFVIKP
jgi:hypothetical protein